MSMTTLIQADARHVPLADGSVHCAVTSPPYWGLRDYGIPPSVWGGEVGCCHEWAATAEPLGCGTDKTFRRDRQAGRARGGLQPGTCFKCGAWHGCLGLEPTPEMFVSHLVEVMREVRRVLRPDGTLWMNLGDSYATGAGSAKNPGGRVRPRELPGSKHLSIENYPACQPNRMPIDGCKPKDLVGIPWMAAFALRTDGWYLRQDIIWHKPNPMPESVTDRCTKGHEYLFLLTKSERYYYDADAIREPVTSTGGASFGKQDFDASGTGAQSRKLADPKERNHPLGRNKRSVWTIATQPFPEAHFATFPTRLVEPCIKAGTSEKGCCSRCGAQWKRIVERGEKVQMRGGPYTGTKIHEGTGAISPMGATSSLVSGMVGTRIHVGWQPTCDCNAGDPIPCTVFDPFNGAATTGVSAMLNGRRYVGTERKLEYLQISRTRLERTAAELATPKRSRKSRPLVATAAVGEPDLFNGPSLAGEGAAA